MASTFNYATEQDLEDLIGVSIDASFSSRIDTWITAAERRVNQYLGFTTVSGLWNESITGEKIEARVDGDINLVVYPRKRPINSVSALSLIKGTDEITLNLTDADGNNRYIIPAQENVLVYPSFELSTTTSTVLLNNFADVKFSRWYTKMSYIAGYTSIPEDISLATTLITADTFMRQGNKENLSSITQGRITKRWRETKDGESSYIREAKAILNTYRIASGWL